MNEILFFLYGLCGLGVTLPYLAAYRDGLYRRETLYAKLKPLGLTTPHTYHSATVRLSLARLGQTDLL